MTEFVEPCLPGTSGGLSPQALSEALVASAGDAILALDARGAVVVWNEGCEALFGWSASEMHGRSAEVLVPANRRDELLRIVRGLDGEREIAALETERVHKLGEVRPVSCRLSPILDSEGVVVGVSAVVRDNSREIELRRQLEHARHVAEARFEQSVVAQATLSPQGVLIDVNQALCTLSGYQRQELLGRHVTDYIAALDWPAVVAGLARLTSGEAGGGRHPQLLRHARGHLVETRVSVFPVRGDLSPDVLRVEAVLEDVSDAAAAQRELRVREARWRSLAAHSADVGLFCDARGTVLFVTPAVEAVFGYGRNDFSGLDGFAFVHPDDVEAVRAHWDAVAASARATTGTLDLRLLHADGSWRWVELSLTNQLADPQVEAMVVNLVDVSSRRTAEKVLEELAGVDTLTGLSTRAPLMAALDAALSAALGPRTAVLVLDVAELTLINDRYGHPAGDQVLVHVGNRLLETAGGRGLVARLGGDRFAVLLSDVGDVGEAFETAAAHLAALRAPVQVGDVGLVTRAAVGVALGPALSSGALLASAEDALTGAKRGLTGPVQVVRAETESVALARARLLHDLRRGLAEDELVVHFQPVVSLSTGLACGAEALVRWQHPDKGLLPPGAFIDVAESSSAILDLGQKVLSEACRAAARWQGFGLGGEPFYVSVNLSARQLAHPSTVEVVRAALRDAGLGPEHLVLEVTESAVMSDVTAAVAALRELRDMGVSVAIDDFGTGYSSLTYLKQFPATAVKIDRSFVSGLGRNQDDAAIVASVVDLAGAMGLACVAEGVETQEQRLVLQGLGCPSGQGYLWAPALERTAFEAWLGAPDRRPPPTGDLPLSRSVSAPAHTGRRRPVEDPDGGQAASLLSARDRAVELASRGASLHTIAAALNSDRLTTGRGRRWTPRTVAGLLSASGAS